MDVFLPLTKHARTPGRLNNECRVLNVKRVFITRFRAGVYYDAALVGTLKGDDGPAILVQVSVGLNPHDANPQ
jgi:hypothetical protein